MNEGTNFTDERAARDAEAPKAHDRSRGVSARAEMLLEFVADRESEYSRISRFLHDDVGQVLSAVGLQLDALRREFSDAPQLGERAAEIQELLEGVIGRIRDLSYELNPSVVQRTGLQFAVNRLADRFRARFSGMRVQLDPAVRVRPQQAETMFRAAEAVVELACAHSECTNVDIYLKRARSEFVLELRANCRLNLETESRFPALLANYYGNRNGVILSVNRAGEMDTIIRLSCAAAD